MFGEGTGAVIELFIGTLCPNKHRSDYRKEYNWTSLVIVKEQQANSPNARINPTRSEQVTRPNKARPNWFNAS